MAVQDSDNSTSLEVMMYSQDSQNPVGETDLEMKTMKERIALLEQRCLLYDRLATINGIEHATSTKDRPTKQSIPLWRRLPGLISLFFVAVNIAAIPVLVAQVVLIAVGNGIWTSVGFVIFNLLVMNCLFFGGNFCACWASSLNILRMTLISSMVIIALQAVWMYCYFGVIAFVPSVVYFVWSIGCLQSSALLFTLFTSQPYNQAFESWLSEFRMFAIVVVPIIATYIRTGTATAISFYAVVIFNIGISFFCNNIRLEFSLHPAATSLGSLLNKIDWYRFTVAYLPVIGMIIVFVAFYLVTVSGLDRTGEDLSVFLIFFSVLLIVFLSWFIALAVLPDYSPRNSFLHRKLSAIKPEQYDLLLHTSGRTDATQIASFIQYF